MLAKLIAFIRSLFGKPSTSGRSYAEAQKLQRQAAVRIAAEDDGLISCPFHNETGESLSFNAKTNSFRCAGCKRSGTMTTLRARLQNPDVYRETVE